MALLAFGMALAIDRWVYHQISVGKEAVEGRLWYEATRAAGTMLVWAGVGVLVGLVWRGPRGARVRAGVGVFAGALLAGLAAELIKPIVGRERPLLHDGAMVFYPLTGWLSGLGKSFPSSHAAVAFGGALMLRARAKRAGSAWQIAAWLGLAVAVACALGRMLTGAHFLSDVVAGGMLGALARSALVRWFDPLFGAGGERPGTGTLRA